MGSDLRSSITCHHFAPILLLLYEGISDVVLERRSVDRLRLQLPPTNTACYASMRETVAHSGVIPRARIRGTFQGLSARSMDPRFAQLHPWIVRIHALPPTYIHTCTMHGGHLHMHGCIL